MSFALTVEQLRARSKTVTRRTGWRTAKVGDVVQPVVQVQGLPRGARVEKIGGPIRFVAIARVPLNDITQRDVEREGFPGMTPADFVALFRQTNGGSARQLVTRIRFQYVD